MKGKYKSFTDLNKDANKDFFAKFLEMTLQEKVVYLKEHGITWGADYLGAYCESTKTVRIETLENPFTGKPIEGAIQGRPSFNDGAQIVVRLKTGKIENQKSTPNNIFGFEYIGKLNKKRYVDLSDKASISSLQEENNKLTKQNSALKKIAKSQEDEIAEYKKTYKNLQEDIRRLSSNYEVLEQEKQFAENLGKKVCHDLELEKENLRQRLAENRKIAKLIIDKNITELLHVTNINNLERILKEGIVPVAKLGSCATRNDTARYDRKPGCSSLSVSRVNSWYFRKVASRDPGQQFVCIIIKPSVLLDENIKYYCHHNAATGSISDATACGCLTTAEDFEYMFANTVEYTTINGRQSCFRTSAHKNNWTTSDQAEILYEGVISPEAFVGVAFPSEAALQSARILRERYGIELLVNRALNFDRG